MISDKWNMTGSEQRRAGRCEVVVDPKKTIERVRRNERRMWDWTPRRWELLVPNQACGRECESLLRCVTGSSQLMQ
uniref:Uncharacterized protein n=1 Tax=Ditylenchus dipsaci TaxID=166011 RepID=A0A915E1Y1_9BILA